MDTEGSGQCCIQNVSELCSRTPPQTLQSIVRSFTLNFILQRTTLPTGFRVQELFRTESIVPRIGHPQLTRALSPLVQIAKGLSLPSLFECCTTFRALRLCMHMELQSTCLSLRKLLTHPRCAALAVHDRPPRLCQVSDHRCQSIHSDSAEDSATSNYTFLQLLT